MDTKQSAEDKFRDGLMDLLALVGKLGTVCQTTAELAGVCELALSNDAQLKLLMWFTGTKQR